MPPSVSGDTPEPSATAPEPLQAPIRGYADPSFPRPVEMALMSLLGCGPAGANARLVLLALAARQERNIARGLTGPVSAREVADVAGFVPSTTSRILRSLAAAGLVSMVTTNRASAGFVVRGARRA